MPPLTEWHHCRRATHPLRGGSLLRGPLTPQKELTEGLKGPMIGPLSHA